MRCPNCSAEAGDAATCPSCGKALSPAPAPAPEAAAPAPAAPAPDAIQVAVRAGWRNTLLTIGIAIVLGVIAGYLARKFLGPAPDPACMQLCQFADIPAVAHNGTWQQQISDAHCRCDQVPKLPKQAAEPVHPAMPPVLPAPPPPVLPAH